MGLENGKACQCTCRWQYPSKKLWEWGVRLVCARARVRENKELNNCGVRAQSMGGYHSDILFLFLSSGHSFGIPCRLVSYEWTTRKGVIFFFIICLIEIVSDSHRVFENFRNEKRVNLWAPAILNRELKSTGECDDSSFEKKKSIEQKCNQRRCKMSKKKRMVNVERIQML